MLAAKMYLNLEVIHVRHMHIKPICPAILELRGSRWLQPCDGYWFVLFPTLFKPCLGRVSFGWWWWYNKPMNKNFLLLTLGRYLIWGDLFDRNLSVMRVLDCLLSHPPQTLPWAGLNWMMKPMTKNFLLLTLGSCSTHPKSTNQLTFCKLFRLIIIILEEIQDSCR